MNLGFVKNIICSIVFASTLVAQTEASGPPSSADHIARRVNQLTTLLSLTTAQQTQLTALITDEQADDKAKRSTMTAARKALQTAIEANDTASITAQATQIGTLTAQEIESRSKSEAALYALLTPEQQTKFKQLRMMGPGNFSGHGPGPMPNARPHE